MIRAAVLSGVLVLAAAASPAAEPPGASSCSGCHALGGEAAPGIPPILSKSADEITAAMLAYRAGEGGPTVMDRISKGFTEEEIRAIAAWIASRR